MMSMLLSPYQSMPYMSIAQTKRALSEVASLFRFLTLSPRLSLSLSLFFLFLFLIALLQITKANPEKLIKVESLFGK
jgi:hypothetical protein